MKYPNRAYWAMPTAKKRPPMDPNSGKRERSPEKAPSAAPFPAPSHRDNSTHEMTGSSDKCERQQKRKNKHQCSASEFKRTREAIKLVEMEEGEGKTNHM